MIHPVLDFLSRIETRKKLSSADGATFRSVNAAMRHFGDAVDSAMAMAEFKMPVGSVMPDEEVGVGAIADGTFIKTIMDWLKSPDGQAFISAIFKILLSLLPALM